MKGIQDMKKLIFLLILLLLTSIVSSCAPAAFATWGIIGAYALVANDEEQEQESEVQEYPYNAQAYYEDEEREQEEERQWRQHEQEKMQQHRQEQEAKYERFRNEERYRKISQEDVTYYNDYTVCYLSNLGPAEAFSLGEWIDRLLQTITKSNLDTTPKGEFYIKENFTEIIFKITRGGKNMFISLIYDNNKVCLPKEMTVDNKRLLDCNEILMMMSMLAQ